MIIGYFLRYWKLIVSVLLGAILLFAAYTFGKNSEKVSHQETVLKYKQEVIDLQTKQTQELLNTMKVFNEASTKYQTDMKNISPIVKEIRTNTIKEIQKPVYKECVMSEDFFTFLNKKIEELNRD